MESLADVSSVTALATALSVATGAYALGQLVWGRRIQEKLADQAKRTREETNASWDSEETEMLCGAGPSKDELVSAAVSRRWGRGCA